MNIEAPWPDLEEAEQRVHLMQTKLHRWAISDPDRRFSDLHNLVYDPAFLVVAWNRVWGNREREPQVSTECNRAPSAPGPGNS